jgi:general secretion pathway protein I
MRRTKARGFTLVEVLVALMIVAMGLAALMTAVSGTARASGYLRDKTMAQWIALNRLTEVRLNLNTLGDDRDTGQLDFANRKWHYDTRYFATSVASMKRVVVRVWAGDSKTKGNPIAESTGFLGTTLGTPGSSNVADWTTGTVATTPPSGQNGQPCPTGATGTAGTTVAGIAGATGTTVPCTQPTVNTPPPAIQ